MTKQSKNRTKFSELLLCGFSYPCPDATEDSHVLLYEEAFGAMLWAPCGTLLTAVKEQMDPEEQ